MDNAVREKLESMKKIRKILVLTSACLSLVAFVILVLFNFMPAANLTLKGSDKFAKGFDYPGWQLIFYGMGIQFIPNYYEFGFDIWTFLGLFVPVIAMLVCYIIYRRGKNLQKAVCEFVMAGALIFGGIMLMLCAELAINVAAYDVGVMNFRDSYLYPAIAAGTYKLLAFPIITFFVCLIAALVKICNGAFMLYQKAYGVKNVGMAATTANAEPAAEEAAPEEEAVEEAAPEEEVAEEAAPEEAAEEAAPEEAAEEAKKEE